MLLILQSQGLSPIRITPPPLPPSFSSLLAISFPVNCCQLLKHWIYIIDLIRGLLISTGEFICWWLSEWDWKLGLCDTLLWDYSLCIMKRASLASKSSGVAVRLSNQSHSVAFPSPPKWQFIKSFNVYKLLFQVVFVKKVDTINLI